MLLFIHTNENRKKNYKMSETPHMVNTRGEIDHWLHEEAIGGTPFSATFLEVARQLAEDVKDPSKFPAELNTQYDLDVVLGMIGRRTETRIKNEGGPKHIEAGTAPIGHVVMDTDIAGVLDELNPQSPHYKNYVDSDSMFGVAMALVGVTRKTVPPEAQQAWDSHGY